MEAAKTIIFLMLRGVKDSMCNIVIAFWNLRKGSKNYSTKSVAKQTREDKSGNVLDILMQCVMFGVLFCAANWLFEYCILNFSGRYFGLFLDMDEIKALWWLPKLMYLMFFICWIVPLFFISRLLNYSWYQEIADLTYEDTRMKKETPFSFTYSVSDQALSAFVQLLFFTQAYVVYLLPIPKVLQYFISNLHMSLLYSLYAFEYKWVHMRWPLKKRLFYIDAKWPYFIGYGLPLALVSSCASSYLNSVCIFSALFPIYVVSSAITFDSEVQNYSQPLRSFTVVHRVANAVSAFIAGRVHKE
ncbi:etoposide-induced protein 2.4 homolog [Stegodyphus dumicola]|uniref:etoposide-induced protein 2.4 homolog n=1 Tax=Stegodyphus dumicola TaxID=202533 RepID=UPI0015ABC76C|nr:etoposide-induced protein 2.4 homolog [Stegodyphus dumicola]